MSFFTESDSRFGLAVPQVFVRSGVEMDAVATTVKDAEAAGVHSLWVQSQSIGRSNVLEPITLLSYVSAITERVKLGTSVLIVPEHAPIELAKKISTLDRLSHGRLIVGLGTGVPRLRPQIGGFDMDRSVQRLLDAIRIMQALWTDDNATVQGEIWGIEGLSMNPKPVQQPHPPLWLGGRTPNALRRAVRYGDGWMGPGASSTKEFAETVPRIREALEDIGRPYDDFTISKRVFVAIEKDRKHAEQRLIERFDAYSGNGKSVPEVCVYGTGDEVAEGIQRIIDAGAELVVLNTAYDFVRQQDAIIQMLAG